MEAQDYQRHLRADGEALEAAARQAPDAAIASCPGWDMTALVGHVGRVYGWVEHLVATRATQYQKRPTPPSEGFDATVAWYHEGLDRLLRTLAETDPAEAVWNWADQAPGPARFWSRRMAQETAVHRWDAQAAAATPEPIDRELAVDGIDEYLGFVGGWLARKPIERLDGSLHLHATDGEGEWSLYLRPDGLEHIREHIKADAAIRGPVSDLLLWLLNRVPADSARFQVFGKTELIDAWRQVQF